MKSQILCPSCKNHQLTFKTKCQQLDIYKCNNCDLTFTNPLLNGEEEDTGKENSSITEKEFYEGILKNHDLQINIAKRKAPLMLKEYTKIMGQKPLSILEVGCGTGQYSDAWDTLNVKWLGVEINKLMLDFCQKHNKNVITFEKFSQSETKFDVIFLSQVLEHILDPTPFLNLLVARLNDGGILHIDVPNHDGLISNIRKISLFKKEYGFIQPNHHLIAYNQKSLSTLISNIGLKTINLKPYVNNDHIYGQLSTNNTFKAKIIFFLPKALKQGSLLVCIAQKPNQHLT